MGFDDGELAESSHSETEKTALSPFSPEFLEALPKPVFWRLLVMPKAPEETSKGGIVLTAANQDAQQFNTYVGQVLAVGPLAGERAPLNEAPWTVEPGDWVLFGKYAGQRVEFRGVRLLFINDEDILGTIADPDGLRIFA